MQWRRFIPSRPILVFTAVCCVLSTSTAGYFLYRAHTIEDAALRGDIVVSTLPAGGGAEFVKVQSAREFPTATSESKLGLFILSSYSDGARRIISSRPRVIKVMDPHVSESLLEAVRDYRRAAPNGTVILRISGREPAFDMRDDPVEAANQYFAALAQPALEALKPYRDFFTYIESPNETENTVSWETVEMAGWNASFWSRLIELYADAGYKTCVGSIPVGNPGGSIEQIEAKLRAFLPAVQAAVRTGGALCYHAYSTEYSTDVSLENWWSLRYRILHATYSKIDPSLAALPVILSEGGIDKAGNPEEDGWQARGDESKFTAWLEWFDQRLREDPYVVGAALFQIGDTYWSSFNLEPVAWWLKQHLEGAGALTPRSTISPKQSTDEYTPVPPLEGQPDEMSSS